MNRNPRSSPYQRIYDVVRRIPNGRVATYGRVARLAGLPNRARQVGYALSSTPEHLRLPLHRVVNAKGEISARSEPYGPHIQRARLEQEKIIFDANARISLRRFQWTGHV